MISNICWFTTDSDAAGVLGSIATLRSVLR